MLDISKKIVTDEEGTPVAVQIDYSDWEQIEEQLRSSPEAKESGSSFESTLEMTRDIWTGEDGLTYQRQIRSEWEQRGNADTES